MDLRLLPEINDTTPEGTFMDPTKGTGLELPRGFRGPEDYVRGDGTEVAKPFPQELVLDDSSIQALIKEREERKQRHVDIAAMYNLACKDQQRTNYCWINSPAYCQEYLQVLQNQKLTYLSPASGGSVIKGFRNNGGWGREALEFLQERGLVPVDKWPANAIDQRYNTPENWELAKNYRATEWWVFKPRDLRAVASCVLGQNRPVSGGFNWWSHQVTYVDFVWENGTFVPIIRNSWGMGWGTNGYGKLQGSRGYADDACAPAVTVAH